MTGTPSTDPLSDLLTDLADAAGAHHGPLDHAVVARVATRVRRRRAARHTGTGLAAAGVVGAVTVGATHASWPGGSRAVPGGTTASAPLVGTPGPTADPQPLDASAEPGTASEPQRWQQYFECGQVVALGAGERPDAKGLVLDTSDPHHVMLGTPIGTPLDADLPLTPSYALADADGVVVGYQWPDEDETVIVTDTSGTWIEMHDDTHLVACGPDEPSGDVTAWPFAPATVRDAAGVASQVVVVGEPEVVTLP